MQYKISTSIYVRYFAVNRNPGLTDLYIIPSNPSGVDQTSVLMTHLENGLYTATFTPNATGWWQVRVHSATSAVEVYSARYYVGTTDDPNPVQDDTFTGRVGEVQATPTANTLLGRLKDIYDKLVNLFTDGTAKIKIWDGTQVATITADGSKKRLDVDVGNVTINPYPGRGFIASILNGTSSALNVNGSITPVSFQNGPAAGKIWYVFNVSIVIEDGSMNFAKFGGLPALTNGVDFKVKQDGAAEVTIANIKRNAGFYSLANDVLIDSSTTDILVAQLRPFVNTGTCLKLIGSNSEYFKAVVNDDLTSVDYFTVTIRGYEINA